MISVPGKMKTKEWKLKSGTHLSVKSKIIWWLHKCWWWLVRKKIRTIELRFFFHPTFSALFFPTIRQIWCINVQMWGFQNVYNFESPPKKNHITNLLFFIFKTQRHATHLVNSGFPVIDDFFYSANCSSFKRKKSFTVINISLFKKLFHKLV